MVLTIAASASPSATPAANNLQPAALEARVLQRAESAQRNTWWSKAPLTVADSCVRTPRQEWRGLNLAAGRAARTLPIIQYNAACTLHICTAACPRSMYTAAHARRTELGARAQHLLGCTLEECRHGLRLHHPRAHTHAQVERHHTLHLHHLTRRQAGRHPPPPPAYARRALSPPPCGPRASLPRRREPCHHRCLRRV